MPHEFPPLWYRPTRASGVACRSFLPLPLVQNMSLAFTRESFCPLHHTMATRMSASAAWGPPSGSSMDLSTSYADAVPKDAREAFDAYQDHRALEGTLATAGYWQYHQCLKEGFQATDEAGAVGCRGGVPGVACASYDPARAGYERAQQIYGGIMERQMDIPDAVEDLFARGMDLEEAYAKAGVPMPCGAAAAAVRIASAGEPSASLMRAGSKAQRLAVGGAGGISTYGMPVAAAYRGGRIVSSREGDAPAAYEKGRPAGMPAPGAKPAGTGAQIYTRMHESGSGPTTYATMATHDKTLYSQPAAAGRMVTEYRC